MVKNIFIDLTSLKPLTRIFIGTDLPNGGILDELE